MSLRGHEIIWCEDNSEWLYKDANTPTLGNERNCKLCGLPPTEDGHDPCIANLDGVMNACCGHGDLYYCYVQKEDRSCVREGEAMELQQSLLKLKENYK